MGWRGRQIDGVEGRDEDTGGRFGFRAIIQRRTFIILISARVNDDDVPIQHTRRKEMIPEFPPPLSLSRRSYSSTLLCTIM